MAKEKNVLNKSEKQEIVSDVKEAIDKARNSSNIIINNKQKIKTSIIIPSVIIVLIISFVSIYWYFANNPKTLFIRSAGAVFETLNNAIPKNNLSGSIDIKNNVKIGNTNLAKYDFKLDYAKEGTNTVNKLKTNYENKPLSEITFYNIDKGYLYIPDLSDKYIYTSENYFNYSPKDIEIIIKSIDDAFVSAINGYKFSGTKVKLKIEDNLKQVNKTSLSLNSKDISLVFDEIKSYLNNDNTFKISYKKVFNIENFEEKINNLKTIFQNSDNLTINIYTSTIENSFIKLELIESKNNKLNTLSITNLSKNKYDIILDNQTDLMRKEYVISFKENKNGFIYNIDVEKENNNIKVLDMETKIKLEEKENKISVKENFTDVIDYNTLSNDEKGRIDSKLNPLQSFINEVLRK